MALKGLPVQVGDSEITSLLRSISVHSADIWWSEDLRSCHIGLNGLVQAYHVKRNLNGRLLRGRAISVEPVWQTAHLRKQANGISPVTYQTGQSERPAPFTTIHGHDDSDTLRSTSTEQATPDATDQAAPDPTKQPEMRSPLALSQDQNSTNGHGKESSKQHASGSTNQPTIHVPVTSTHDQNSTNGYSSKSSEQHATASIEQPVIQGPFTLAHVTLAHTQNNTNGHSHTSSKQDASGPTEKPETRAQFNLARDQNSINGHGSTSKKQDAPDLIGQLAIRAPFPVTRVQDTNNGYHSVLPKQDASDSIDQPTMYAPVASTHDQNITNGDNFESTKQVATGKTNQSATNSKDETENRVLLAVAHNQDDTDADSSTSRSRATPNPIVLTQGQTSIRPTQTPNDSYTQRSDSNNRPAPQKTNGIARDPTDQTTPGSPEIDLAAVAYAKLLASTAKPENTSTTAQPPDSNQRSFAEEPKPVNEPRVLTSRTPLRRVIGSKEDRKDLNSSPGHPPPPRFDRKAANERDRNDFASLRPRPKR